MTRVEHGADDSITIALNDDVEYYLFHVIVQNGITEGTDVTAAQQIGTTPNVFSAVDFGVQNRNITRTFIVPARYIDRQKHAPGLLQFLHSPS